MVEFCERVMAYIAGHDLPSLLADTVWLIVTSNVPRLRDQLIALLATLG